VYSGDGIAGEVPDPPLTSGPTGQPDPAGLDYSDEAT
jgi:hypothetical protein